MAATRIEWKIERDRIDLVAVATGLLGPAPGRRGEHGAKPWWNCPLHDDHNPSFTIDPARGSWKCYGCGEHGDAASLVMKVEGVTFPQAVARLTGGAIAPAGVHPGPRPTPPPKPETPSGLPQEEALALVEDAESRLWSPEGAEALAYLTGPRELAPQTIRAARLGWTPKVSIPKKNNDGWYHARGIAIPWFKGGRLSKVNLRQPDGDRPKYAEAYRDGPGLYLGPGLLRPGLPLILPEGEFDALLLGQEVGELASVATLGSASARPKAGLLETMLAAPRWYISTDADDAGDRAAEGWPARARRARPPGAFKDWTEMARAGVDLARWWADRLGGVERPALFTWEDLSTWRWGPATGNPGPGIMTPAPRPNH